MQLNSYLFKKILVEREIFFPTIFDERRMHALEISALVLIDVYASTREDTIVEIEICLS